MNTTNNLPHYTLFYDGFCPLCQAEMKKLRQFDTQHRLRFVDIQDANFQRDYAELDWDALNARIHLQKPDGSLMTGLDATHLAWSAVGKGWVYAPLRWPLIRWFADKAYNFFARHRYRISYLLTGKARCDVCVNKGDYDH